MKPSHICCVRLAWNVIHNVHSKIFINLTTNSLRLLFQPRAERERSDLPAFIARQKKGPRFASPGENLMAVGLSYYLSPYESYAHTYTHIRTCIHKCIQIHTYTHIYIYIRLQGFPTIPIYPHII